MKLTASLSLGFVFFVVALLSLPVKAIPASYQRPLPDAWAAEDFDFLDSGIRIGLLRAGASIEELTERNQSSGLPYKFIGRYGPFKMIWQGTYWIVTTKSPIPTDLAKMIYADPIGRRVIRMNGMSSNMDPLGQTVTSYHVDTDQGLHRLINLYRSYELNLLGDHKACEYLLAVDFFGEFR